MNYLLEKKILLIICGGISAYKSLEVIRSLKKKGAKVLGIVGRDGGYTKKAGDNIILIPTINKKLVTPYCESFHSVIWHCLVSHPILQKKKMKW